MIAMDGSKGSKGSRGAGAGEYGVKKQLAPVLLSLGSEDMMVMFDVSPLDKSPEGGPVSLELAATDVSAEEEPPVSSNVNQL